IKPEQQEKIEDISGQSPLKIVSQTLHTAKDVEDVVMTNTVKNEQPKLSEGHYPKKDNEIAINSELTARGVDVGDNIKIKDGKRLQVSVALDDRMYSHSSVVMMNNNGFDELNKNVSTVYPIKDMSQKQMNKLEDINGIDVFTEDDITSEIPSYQAEQA